MILMGGGQIGTAIARRVGAGKTMAVAGFEIVPVEADISDRASVQNLVREAQKYGDIRMLVNSAGISPPQGTIEDILRIDLYGTAVLLEEVGKVIAPGGVGVTISSQPRHRMPQLTAEQDEALVVTPAKDLLSLDSVCPENIRDTLHAYQMSKLEIMPYEKAE